ncbi:hypothetical protein V512_011690 [Mesotoga sp. Brook.08.105.5.1]|nr:hypothetical protein V512_011690 [Mesotoga sp. Brook.08.105.5.1]RAO97609.1 hypothetical protein M388_10405 [Mesotoga sp. Brook.08.YT.4.2.5.4.]
MKRVSNCTPFGLFVSHRGICIYIKEYDYPVFTSFIEAKISSRLFLGFSLIEMI